MEAGKLKVLNTIGFIFMITMNMLAVFLPLAGKTTGELSDKYPNLFVPAGFTFSIWSVIYLLIIGMIGYQWFKSKGDSQIEAIGFLFFANSIFNGVWIAAWHYEILPLSILLMLGILSTLILMHRKLDVSYFGDRGIKWLVHVPVSVYLGWISVATIANVTTLLVNAGWSGFGIAEDTWAAAMLIIAVVLAIMMMYRHKDIFFAAVVAWASYGVLSKRLIDSSAQDAQIEHVSQVAIYIVLVGIMLTIVLGILGNQKKT